MKTNLKKHDIVFVDGQPVQLTKVPQKTIVGTWLVWFRTEVGGPHNYVYATNEELQSLHLKTKEATA
jgi:hypothetical protein